MVNYFKKDVDVGAIEPFVADRGQAAKELFESIKGKKKQDDADRAFCVLAGMVWKYCKLVDDASEHNKFNVESLGIDGQAMGSGKENRHYVLLLKERLGQTRSYLRKIIEATSFDEGRVYFKEDPCENVKLIFQDWKDAYGVVNSLGLGGRRSKNGKIGVLEIASELGANMGSAPKTDIKDIDKLCQAICKIFKDRLRRSKLHFKAKKVKDKVKEAKDMVKKEGVRKSIGKLVGKLTGKGKSKK